MRNADTQGLVAILAHTPVDPAVASDTVAAVERALRLASAETDATARRRRETFLRSCWPSLGPTQQQHVSVHCQAVASVAGRLARLNGLSEWEVARVRLAGLMHDIGKVLIPETLLAKPARLDPAETCVMRAHAPIGAMIARALGTDRRTVAMIEHHHSSDSHRGLTPVHLVGAADALVSMMTDRPYCAARPIGAILAEMRRCAPVQFHPAAVTLAYRLYGGARVAA